MARCAFVRVASLISDGARRLPLRLAQVNPAGIAAARAAMSKSRAQQYTEEIAPRTIFALDAVSGWHHLPLCSVRRMRVCNTNWLLWCHAPSLFAASCAEEVCRSVV